jgi:hypothetical protein
MESGGQRDHLAEASPASIAIEQVLLDSFLFGFG